MLRETVFMAVAAARVALGVCDGNPHEWGRLRRCDQVDPACPDVSWSHCGMCEGIGGLVYNDDNTAESFQPAKCTPLMSAADMARKGIEPKSPHLPDTFVNTGFHEIQIFVRHDPFCFAQIPAMTSNGTHCYKNQEGTFNYDATQGALRIDYKQANTVFAGANMTEVFYHLKDGTVHPSITKYGALDHLPICPCIKLGVGPVSTNWADDAELIGREIIEVEFVPGAVAGSWLETTADHYIKGPHHVWVDVDTGYTVRMWQPFNGLETFDPTKWSIDADAALPEGAFKLPLQCTLEAAICINGELGTDLDNNNADIPGLDKVVEELDKLAQSH